MYARWLQLEVQLYSILFTVELTNFQMLQFEHSFGAFVITLLTTSENGIFLTVLMYFSH